jgi:pimeloyl-ACP methyl ester carboxylesterase
LREFDFTQVDNLKITISNGDFNCRVLGNGTKIFIAFHGFGQDGNAFRKFALGEHDATIYAFDLPFHGYTEIRDLTMPLIDRDMEELIQKLLGIKSIVNFSLIGFSIGAKLIFSVVEKFYTRIKEVWLLAPDGISANFWYGLATKNRTTQYLFQMVLHHPALFNRLGRVLQFTGLVDQKILLFALKSIDSDDKRLQVYNTWMYLRKLKLRRNQLIEILNKEKIPVYFILGNSDKIINSTSIVPLYRKLSYAQIIELSCGHQNLINKFTDWYSVKAS